MSPTKTAQQIRGLARQRPVMPAMPGTPTILTISNRIRWLGVISGLACIAAVAATATGSAQQRPSPKEPRPVTAVTALVVMTPNGPATCSTWVQWRLPTAHPVDTAAVEYWAEGYLSGLAAGTRHDVIGEFRHQDLATWLTNYCTANPQTPLPDAIIALGRAMLAHPGGPL
jgi:hypothetical protein